jgi:hypothetical protein
VLLPAAPVQRQLTAIEQQQRVRLDRLFGERGDATSLEREAQPATSASSANAHRKRDIVLTPAQIRERRSSAAKARGKKLGGERPVLSNGIIVLKWLIIIALYYGAMTAHCSCRRACSH